MVPDTDDDYHFGAPLSDHGSSASESAKTEPSNINGKRLRRSRLDDQYPNVSNASTTKVRKRAPSLTGSPFGASNVPPSHANTNITMR